jgi:hypothetical protein
VYALVESLSLMHAGIVQRRILLVFSKSIAADGMWL